MGSQQFPTGAVSPLAPSVRQQVIRFHHSKILAFFRALDAFLIAFLLWVTLAAMQQSWTNDHTVMALFAIIVFGFFAEGNEVYYLWRGHSMSNLAFRLLSAWMGTGLLIITAALLFSPVNRNNILPIIFWVGFTPVVMVGMHLGRRLILAYLRSKPTEPRRVAIVGATELGMRLVKSMQGMPWLGYRVLGFYDDRVECDDVGRRIGGQDMVMKGDIAQLFADAQAGKIDSVFITLPMRAELRMRALISNLSDTTVSAYVIPDIFSFDLLHSRLTCVQGIPALSIYDSPLVDNGWIKRLADIVIGTCMLIGLAIPMAIVAIGVKLSSPGPILFKQLRYGMNGESIRVWKFRSMTVCEDGANVTQAQRSDPRITRFGAFIRRTSLDELPQLFNVISGSMSLVGPRPHAVSHNEFYRKQIKGYMLRHKVKPGITGLAQISGFRGETETLDKMSGRIAYDLEYISNWSLSLDLKILWLTLFRGFVGKNVY